MPKKAYGTKQIVITSNRLSLKQVDCWGHLEIAFVVRNMKSMWVIKQKHMYIVNSSTCSIAVYFRAESSIQPLDGNTSKHFWWHEPLMINHPHSVPQCRPGNHYKNNTTDFMIDSFNAHL